MNRATLLSKIKVCAHCAQEFIPLHHGGTKQFCSRRCANIYHNKNRELKVRKPVYRMCQQCGNQFEKNQKLSLTQWNRNKFCSIQCAALSRRINDGMTNHERRRRKLGRLKEKTPEWLERIKATTKQGMMKPEVQEKLHAPRQPMSTEGKIIRSDALAGIMPKNLMYSNLAYPNIKRGNYLCSKGDVYFRSKWEANYALYLDFLVKNGNIKDWEYESETFFFDKIKLGTRSYRPDFPVINNDDSKEYHEVKGYMDARSKTKLKRMAKYFPDIKLVLIDRAYYMDMMKKMKGIIKFY